MDPARGQNTTSSWVTYTGAVCMTVTVSEDVGRLHDISVCTYQKFAPANRSWLLGEKIIHVRDGDACKLLMTCEHDLVEGEPL